MLWEPPRTGNIAQGLIWSEAQGTGKSNPTKFSLRIIKRKKGSTENTTNGTALFC